LSIRSVRLAPAGISVGTTARKARPPPSRSRGRSVGSAPSRVSSIAAIEAPKKTATSIAESALVEVERTSTSILASRSSGWPWKVLVEKVAWLERTSRCELHGA
jgi:hypothetical protein